MICLQLQRITNFIGARRRRDRDCLRHSREV